MIPAQVQADIDLIGPAAEEYGPEYVAAYARLLAWVDSQPACHCRDCKHWEPQDWQLRRSVPFAACQSPLLRVGTSIQAANEASVADDITSLDTGPDFGCVNWEASE